MFYIPVNRDWNMMIVSSAVEVKLPLSPPPQKRNTKLVVSLYTSAKRDITPLLLTQTDSGQVGWGCRIHQLHLCWGLRFLQ